MLLLVGLGLETKDLSVRALEEIKKADQLFLETYTSFIPEDYRKFIQKEAGKKVVPVSRQDLEEKVKETVAKAKNKKIVILIPGDPLIATTHSIILNEAKKQRVGFSVFHSSSVFSAAIGESGLDVYKFGPTVTIPFWFRNYRPTSFLDVLNKNVKNEEHTLILLDIDQKNKRPMEIGEAMEILQNAAAQKREKRVFDNARMIVLANLGRKDQQIKYLGIGEVNGKVKKELKGKVISFILPGRMSFAEEESLKRVLGSN